MGLGRKAKREQRYGSGFEPDGKCCIRDCGKAIWGFEFCRGHYSSWRKNGHPLYVQRRAPAQRGTARSCTPTYKSWVGAKSRCTNPNDPGFKNYGGRGIAMCDRWLESYDAFLEDMGERPIGCSIDRLDVNGDYTLDNCRWATVTEQNRNTRSTVLSADIVAAAKARRIAGEKIAVIARDLDVSYYALVQAMAGSSWIEVQPAGNA